MEKLLRDCFIQNDAKWLYIILAFELVIALTISPTILTDYSLANYFVELLRFIPTLHAFDRTAVYPEALRFYISICFALLIPKAISIYIILQKSPHSQMSQYVITPYTEKKPERSLNFGEVLTEEEAKELLTVNRSMFSRIIWSLLSLAFAFMCIFVMTHLIGRVDENSLIISKANQGLMNQGGFYMWFSFSVYRLTFVALALAISFFIIRDYYRCFRDLVKKVFLFLNRV